MIDLRLKLSFFEASRPVNRGQPTPWPLQCSLPRARPAPELPDNLRLRLLPASYPNAPQVTVLVTDAQCARGHPSTPHYNRVPAASHQVTQPHLPPCKVALTAVLVLTLLTQGPLKAEPIVRTCVQGVYFGGDSSEQKQGTNTSGKKTPTIQTIQQRIIRSLLWVTESQCCWDLLSRVWKDPRACQPDGRLAGAFRHQFPWPTG